jgi:hypothetical protein
VSGDAGSKSLKSRNMPWLCAVIALDAAVTLAFVFPDVLSGAPIQRLAIGRATLSVFAPVIILLLVGLLPPNAKAMIVYWRIRNPLPGHAAFTKYGPKDDRVDMAALRRNVGEPPTDDPKAQNLFWYKLYKKVSTTSNVSESHRMYLLYRDIATVSLLLMVSTPVCLGFLHVELRSLLIVALIFFVQYLVAAVSARNSGIRFVTSVLAIHSTRKIK